MNGRERGSGGKAESRAPLPTESKLLHEPVERLHPFRRVVCVGGHMPEVRHMLFIQGCMHSLADVEEAVPIAAGKPKQFQLLRDVRIGQEIFGLLRVWRGG